MLSTSALKIITGHRNSKKRAARKAEVNSAVARSYEPREAAGTGRRREAKRGRGGAGREVVTQLVPGPATSPHGFALPTFPSAEPVVEPLTAEPLPAQPVLAQPSLAEPLLAAPLLAGPLLAGPAGPSTQTGPIAAVDDPENGFFKVSEPRTDSLKVKNPGTGSLPVTGSLDLDVTPEAVPEEAPTRGRRAVRPATSRRRLELAVGRAVSHRRVWGIAVAILLVLLVPGTSMLSQSVNVADGGLSSGGTDVKALQEFPDDSRAPAPTAAQTRAARAAAATKETAEATAKAAAAAAKAASKGKTTKKTARVPNTGSLSGITDSASGLGWASGAYIPGSSPSKLAAFGSWRGTGVDVVVDWSARSSWDDIINPTWLYRAWKGTSITHVFGVAPVPEGDSSATMAGCAAGDYNDKWTQFGQNIKNAGLDSSTVIRLGWEFNGDWYKWQASNPSQFAACWRQIVGTVEQVAPKLLWDWNVNRGVSAGLADAAQAYPGDAYVDIVGIDSYDSYPGVTSESAWQTQYSGPMGLKHWVDFAKAHGKKTSIPEWGVYPGTAHAGHNGGDNPFYISKMKAFFESLGSQLVYESYFNDNGSYYAGSIFEPNQNPLAAAKYQALFSG
jgi:hypothetical protein